MEVLELHDRHGKPIPCPACNTIPLREIYRAGVRCGRCPNGHITTTERLELWLQQRKEAQGGQTGP